MESRDLHHIHDLQLFQFDHEFVGSSSSSSSACTTSALASSPYLSVGSSSHAFWAPNFHLITGSRTDTSSSLVPLRDLNQQKNDIQQVSPPPPSLNINSMYQQSFPRSNGTNASPFMVVSNSDMNQEQNLVKIKEEDDEFSGNSPFPKFTDLLNYSSSNSSSLTTLHEDQQLEQQQHHHHHQHHHKNEEDDDEMSNINDLISEKVLLKTLSSNFGVSAGSSGGGGGQFQPNLGTDMPPIRGYLSQIYPSVNISSLKNNNNDNHPISRSSSMVEHLNLEALDLFSPATSSFQPNYSHNSNTNRLAMFKVDGSSSFVIDQIKQSSNPNYHGHDDDLSSLNNNGELESAKRHCNTKTNIVVEPRGVHPQPAPSKRPRCEPRASCPQFKVKKERLGDRIAALQQLVAPFGKTDTASVLMEAIGYIKFLQNQVETLCVPYMRLSGPKSCGEATQRVTTGERESEEAKLPADLRSRGLCLVPLSCMSHITNDGGGGGGGTGSVWPPLNFNPCGVQQSSMCSYS